MRRTWPILRKDLRRLWLYGVLIWPLMYIAVLSPQERGIFGALSLAQLSPLLATLACWNLVIALMQQESLVGETAYWLTRPFKRREIAAAKALAILLLINVPLLICELLVFADNGIEPGRFLSALLWKQVLFTVLFVLPAVAIACVTRNLSHAALSMLMLLLAAGLLLLLYADRHSVPVFNGLSWVAECFTCAVILIGVAAVVYWQYTTRHTVAARLLIGIAAFTALTGARFLPERAAFAVQRLFSPRHLMRSQLSIQFAPGPKCPEYMTRRSSGFVTVEIPIRVSDLPDDSVLLTSSLRLRMPGGDFALNRAHDIFGGHGWLRVYVPAGEFAAHSDAAADLAGSIDMGWFVRSATVRAQDVDSVWPGSCTLVNTEFEHSIRCAAPQVRQCMDVLTSLGNFYPLVPCEAAMPPFAVSPDLHALDRFELLGTPVSVVVHSPAAFVTREFVFRRIRLADFAML
ncbi:MAG TPA: hypothetical protein VN736_29625 [Candidatus Limnocylindrales bacterium]|nr:hypothetical protein [Candidatus Limnocylindrales bacterium]